LIGLIQSLGASFVQCLAHRNNSAKGPRGNDVADVVVSQTELQQ